MKRHSLFLMVCLISVITTACRLEEQDREQMVNLQQEQDNLQGQLVHLNNAISRSKRDGSLYVRRALVYLKMGELEKSLEDANEGIRLSKNEPSALFVKAQVLRATGEYDEALKLAQQAERNSYQSPSLFVLLCDLYLIKGDVVQANLYIDKALEQSSTDEYSLYYKGRILALTGDTTKAVQYLTAALEQHPDFLDPQRELAAVYINQKEYASAKPFLNRVQKQLPKDGQLWYLRGRVYQAEQKQDSAFWSYSHALSLSDSIPEAHYQIGLRLYAQGDNEGTIEHLEKASKAYSMHPKYLTTLASSYERTGQFQKALQLYQRLMATVPAYSYVQQSIERLKNKMERPRADSISVSGSQLY